MSQEKESAADFKRFGAVRILYLIEYWLLKVYQGRLPSLIVGLLRWKALDFPHSPWLLRLNRCVRLFSRVVAPGWYGFVLLALGWED